MSFEIQYQKSQGLHYFVLVDNKRKIQCSIYPDLGANLFSMQIRHRDKPMELINGYSDHSSFQKNDGFKSAKLIPFPNRIRGGKYSFEGKSYQLPINFPAQGHAIHGLIHDQTFQIINKSEDAQSASITLEHHFKGHDAFPFSFRCVQGFSLTDQGLAIKTTVVNTGKTNMPFGDGWHPYFKLGDSGIDSLELEIPEVEEMQIDTQFIPTGETIQFAKFRHFEKIDGHDFDTGFRILAKDKKHKTTLRNRSLGIELSVWQDFQYPYLQIYTPPGRQSIAIEPMTCATDAFNNKMGLHILKPNEQFDAEYGVSVKTAM